MVDGFYSTESDVAPGLLWRLLLRCERHVFSPIPMLLCNVYDRLWSELQDSEFRTPWAVSGIPYLGVLDAA